MIFDYPDPRRQRRHGPSGYASCEPYRPWLRDEFDFRCVYCLKRETWGQVTGEFDLDHFEPQSLRPRRRLDYLNLVYACRRCNSVKRDQAVGDPFYLLHSENVANGETLYLCPEEVHAPHTLIAGTTGSGKSVLIQNLLLDIAITNNCANARIILIDPKQGADYLDLRCLPHIREDIVVTQQRAQDVLEWTVAEMDRRYSLFHAAGVSNLVRYNAQVSPEQRLVRQGYSLSSPHSVRRTVSCRCNSATISVTDSCCASRASALPGLH